MHSSSINPSALKQMTLLEQKKSGEVSSNLSPMLPNQINDLVKWEEDGEPRIWSPPTEKWSSIKKYAVRVEAQIGLTEKTPELERLERLEYILYAMACYTKNIIDEKNKYISNLNEKNKILKKDFYGVHENLELVDKQYKQSLSEFKQVEKDNNNYILELDNELEELYAKLEEYENKILELNEKLKKHELEKIADTESYISHRSNTVSGLIEARGNNSKSTSNINNSNSMQADQPIGLGLQYSKDEESGKEIDLPHKSNTSNFSEYDAEYSSDNALKNEILFSYKQKNSSLMPKKLSAEKGKKENKNIMMEVEVLSNNLNINLMENSKKEDYSEGQKRNNSSSGNYAAICIKKDINTNFDSAYDSSSSRQFTVPENIIETRAKSNNYSAKKNNIPKLSFSKIPPILPPCESILNIEKEEEISNSSSSITKSEIGSRRGSWIDIERSIDSMVSGSVSSKSFLSIEGSAFVPTSSIPIVDSEENKSTSIGQMPIFTSGKPSSNNSEAKIKELEASVKKLKVENVTLKEEKEIVEIENANLLDIEQNKIKLIYEKDNEIKLLKKIINKYKARIKELKDENIAIYEEKEYFKAAEEKFEVLVNELDKELEEFIEKIKEDERKIIENKILISEDIKEIKKDIEEIGKALSHTAIRKLL